MLGEREFPASAWRPVGGQIARRRGAVRAAGNRPRTRRGGSPRLNRRRRRPYPAPVTLDEAFAELGVDPDAGSDGARRAYLRLLKTRKPETDPEGFMRLRAAYELVKANVAFFESFRPKPAGVAPGEVEVAEREVGVADREVGAADGEVGVADREVGVADREVGVADREVAYAPREVGVADREVGVADGEVGVADGEVGVADREVGVAGGEVGVDLGDVALLERLVARSAYLKAAKQALLLLAAATHRLDRPDPPVLTCLRLMLGLHSVLEPAKAREVSTAFKAWLAATGRESTQIRGHAAVLWTLVRELDGMKKRLPDFARAAIARAALEGDLAEAMHDLERFRRKNPAEAQAAGELVRRKAPVIAAALADTLDPPPVASPMFGRRRSSGSRGGFGIVGVLMLGFVRILIAAMRGGPDSPPPSRPLPAYSMPMLTFDAGGSGKPRSALRRDIGLRANTVWSILEAYRPAKPLAGAVVAALDAEDCPRLLAAMEALRAEDARTSETNPSTVGSMIAELTVDVDRYCEGGPDAGVVADAGPKDAGRSGKTLK